MIFSRVKFVLVATSHPGNLGAVARAITNMGFNNLALVNPSANPKDDVAISRAASANETLQNATIHTSLESAISDCTLVFGTRGRTNSLKWREMAPRVAAADVFSHLNSKEDAKVAIVFGTEKTGLSNEMLELCCAHIVIPTAEYASLNLSHAVQLIAYELFLALNNSIEQHLPRYSKDMELKASSSQVQDLLSELENVMIQVRFLDPSKPKKLMPRLRGLFMRTELSENEVQMLRGFLSSIKSNLVG